MERKYRKNLFFSKNKSLKSAFFVHSAVPLVKFTYFCRPADENIMNLDNTEQNIKNDLLQYLAQKGEIETDRFPECIDVENKWGKILQSFIADGVKEYNNYPIATLAWMMYIGMALAKYWDDEWSIYSKIDNIYAYICNKRGFDNIDDYIKEEVLHLSQTENKFTTSLVGECASRCQTFILHAPIENGTPEAYKLFVEVLHQLYLCGMAVQLHRMGYKMTQIN